MSTIYVCPQARLAECLRASRASHVVTLTADAPPAVLADLPSRRWLRLAISDIAAAREGYVLPAMQHVECLIAFVRAWDRRAPLLIHCYAGVSRSTAAAFIALCVLEPEAAETALAARLRAASPTATPNPRLIDLADTILGRAGRMADAIRGIGRGADCFEGNCFALPVPDAKRRSVGQNT